MYRFIYCRLIRITLLHQNCNKQVIVISFESSLFFWGCLMSGLPFPSDKNRDFSDVSTCSFHRRWNLRDLRNCLGRGSLGRVHVGRGRRGSLPGVGVGFLRDVQPESFQVRCLFLVGGAYVCLSFDPLFWEKFQIQRSKQEKCKDIEWCLACSFVGCILRGKPILKHHEKVMSHEYTSSHLSKFCCFDLLGEIHPTN